MKSLLINLFLLLLIQVSFAQKETFDIVNYTAPGKWKKDIQENLTSYSMIDSKSRTWCRA